MDVSQAAGVGVITRGVALWGCRSLVAWTLTFLLGGAPRDANAQAIPRTHLLIVTGASGEPKFAQQFHAVAMALRSAASSQFGIPDSLVTYLAEQTTPDPRAISGRSTKEGVSGAIDRIAARAASGDAVLILLIVSVRRELEPGFRRARVSVVPFLVS